MLETTISILEVSSNLTAANSSETKVKTEYAKFCFSC